MKKKILTALLSAVMAGGLASTAAAVPLPKLGKKIAALVQDITPSLISTRRDLHAHPELSTREFRTSALVARFLEKLGLEVKTGVGGTGVLAVLRGARLGPVVGVRADMDGLPMTEETGLPFASKEKGEVDGRPCGIMHACGHDLHTTVMLGTAEVLARLRADLAGTVVFIGQPAEEAGDGAKGMLEAGVFRDIRPEALFAFHVHDLVHAGVVTYTPGAAAANCDGFRLTIKSEGCHGSAPELCVDPIVVGAQVVVGLQVMLSREVGVQHKAVITVGSFHAGSASNIIPPQAVLEATVRTYGEDQRLLLKDKIERVIAGQCRAARAEYDLDYYFGTMSLYNDPALLQRILPTVQAVLGGREFVREDPPEMGGEDFAHFAREVPSVMLNLGVLPENKEKSYVHSPTFEADEKAIPIGVRLMSSIVVDYLDRPLTKKSTRE